MRWFVTVSLLALLSFTAACGTLAEPIAATEAEEVVDSALVERGVAVYLENYCGVCHTLSVANTRGTFGPNHDNAQTDATHYIALSTYTGRAITSHEYLRESIINPEIFVTPGFEATAHRMPAFAHLSDADVEAMVYMLIHQEAMASSE